MNLKKTLILALVALAIGAYIFYSEMPRLEEKKNQGFILGGIKSDQIDKIDIVNKNGSFALLRDPATKPSSDAVTDKKTARWTLDAATGPELDFGAVNTLLVALTDAKSDNTIPKDELESDLAVYGLTTPQLKLTVASEKGSSELQLGKLNDYAHKRYARLSGKDELYLLSESIFTAANKSVSDFRDKSPIKFADSDLASFSVKSPKGSITLTQSEAKWRVAQPVSADAHDAQVSDLLRNLRNLRVERFYNPAATESDEIDKKIQKAKYGLDTPESSYTLNFKDELKRAPLTIFIGKGIETGEAQAHSDDEDEEQAAAKAPAKRYCFKIEGRDEVYGISGEPVKSLMPTVFDLREKELFNFATDSFLSLELLSKGSTPIKIVKESSKDDTATYKVNDKPGDAAFIEDFIEDLSLVAAQSFPDVSTDFGFNEPTLKVTVKVGSAQGKDPVEHSLVVGSKLPTKKDGKDLYYAAVGDLSEPFTINEDTLKQIAPRAESLVKVEEPAPTPAAVK